MDDETKGNVEAQQDAGQHSEEPIAGGGGEPQPQPEYITKDVFESSLSKLTEELKRTVQSFSDKTEYRLKKQVEERLSNLDKRYRELRAAGVEVDETVYAEERKRIQREALTQDLSTDDGDNESPSAPPSNQQVELPPDYDEYVQGLDQLYMKYGIGLTPLELKDVQGNNAKEALASVEEIIQKKAERLGKLPPGVSGRSPGIGSGATGGGNPLANEFDTDVLWKEYKKRKRG